MKKLLLLCCSIFTLITPAWGEVVEVKGVGTIPYEGSLFSKEPSDVDKKKVQASAKLSAWKNYVATFNEAKRMNVATAENEILQNIDKFITESRVIDQLIDPNLRTYTMVMRVKFDAGQVNLALNNSTVGNRGAITKGGDTSGSLFSFIFMARKATAIKQFDERHTKLATATTSNSVEDAEGGTSVTASESKTSGGSRLRKSDEIVYTVSSSQDIDAAMGEILTTANINYAAYDDIAANCEGGVPIQEFQNEFVNNDELSSETRKRIISSAKKCEEPVKYFAYGTIDTSVNDVDPVSGNQRVYVSVRAQLWDISRSLPRKIGSVGPIQYYGLGTDQKTAGTNALIIAAKESARSLVDQLNAKGVR